MFQDYLQALTPESTLAELPLYDFRVTAEMLCRDVRDRFQADGQLPGALVMEGAQVRTMISRRRLLERLSRPYALDVFLKRPVTELPEYREEMVEVLTVGGELRVAEGLEQALARGEMAYEPLVVETEAGPRLLDVRDLLMAHSRIFQMVARRLDEQQRETETYLRDLERQQQQIRQYARELEQQKQEMQVYSESLQAIQRKLVGIASLFANRGERAFTETFDGIGRIVANISELLQNSYSLRNETVRIGIISETIGEIASRINLLALNASVDFERGAAANRGMSLIAGEVRRLAKETTEAARRIQSLTAAIQTSTDRNVELVQSGAEIAAALREGSRSASTALADLRTLLQDLTDEPQARLVGLPKTSAA